MTGTERYYERRAAEYDRVYDKPERQRDIGALGEHVAAALAGRRVLDVAAGTGFWTERYADLAETVALVDVNPATLDVARGRRSWSPQTTFHEADAFELHSVPGRFDAAFVGFFWSHVALSDLDRFLDGLVARLEPRAVVVLADNVYVEGSNHPLVRTDAEGNTYQRRRLDDGTEWEVRKNFPSPDEVHSRLGRFGSCDLRTFEHFWAARVLT